MRRMFSKRQIEEIVKSNKPTFENITDKGGNPRFVEGDITIKNITGVTKTYGKWSLSGTHLMIMLCIDITSLTSVSTGTTLADIELPTFINSKILPSTNNNAINRKSFYVFTTSGDSVTNMQCILKRKNASTISLQLMNTTSISISSHLMIQFDYLIDNE